MRLSFQVMTSEHAGAVMVIFNHYVEHSMAAYPESPLPEAAFGMFVEKTRGYPAYVIVDEESRETLGFCFLHAYSPFPTFRHTAEVSYFLAPDAVGRGIGAVALERLQQDARKLGITRLLASISSANTASTAFHTKHGFTECGRLHGVGEKKGQTFDVIWMEKAI